MNICVIFNILFFITFKFLSIFCCMVKLVSNRLNKSLSKVYSLSRKNKNETILIWIFLDSDRIYNYKKFFNGIDHTQKLYNFSNKSEDHKNWGFRMWYRIRKKIDKILK